MRQVLVDLMKDDLIFVGADRCPAIVWDKVAEEITKSSSLNSREKLLERGSFFTRYASEIESDPVGEYTRAR